MRPAGSAGRTWEGLYAASAACCGGKGFERKAHSAAGKTAGFLNFTRSLKGSFENNIHRLAEEPAFKLKVEKKHDVPKKIKDLLEGLCCKCLQGDDQVLVSDVVYDSRRVKARTVFVCLIGSAVDSHRYATAKRWRRGRRLVVASRKLELAKRNAGAGGGHPQGDGLYVGGAVRPSAAKLKTVGITGTKGENHPACMIKTILEKGGSRLVSSELLVVIIRGIPPIQPITPRRNLMTYRNI